LCAATNSTKSLLYFTPELSYFFLAAGGGVAGAFAVREAAKLAQKLPAEQNDR
jgi:hypothetical protein